MLCMKSHRENPEGEANQLATKQNEREKFALQMQATIRKSRIDGYCPHCGMMTSQCDCWDSVNGGD